MVMLWVYSLSFYIHSMFPSFQPRVVELQPPPPFSRTFFDSSTLRLTHLSSHSSPRQRWAEWVGINQEKHFIYYIVRHIRFEKYIYSGAESEKAKMNWAKTHFVCCWGEFRAMWWIEAQPQLAAKKHTSVWKKREKNLLDGEWIKRKKRDPMKLNVKELKTMTLDQVGCLAAHFLGLTLRLLNSTIPAKIEMLTQ